MPKVVDPEQRRSDLADATARVIARAGIDGASMREVAAEAGWTTGAVVRYFDDKRELLAFTLHTSLERRRSRHADRGDIAPGDALRATLFGALLTTADTTLHWHVTLAFAGLASSDPKLAEIQRDAYLHFRASVIDLLRQIDDRATADELAGEAERLIALVNGICLQAIFDPLLWTDQHQITSLEAGIGNVTW